MGGDGQYWACAECARKCSKVHGRTSPPSHLSFFKIMLGPFEKSLIVPPKFARLLGNLVGQEVCLENSDGHHWKVKLLKVDNCLAFQQGWNEFVLYHSIQVGEIVVFKYICHASFVVQIFGTSGCERSHFSEIIDSDMHKKCPTDCLSFRKDGRKDATCRVGSCIQDKVSSKEMKSIGTTPCESFSSQHLSKADGDFHKRKRSATECLGHKRKRSATECLAPHNDGRTHDKYAVPCCPTPKDSARKRQAVRTAFCETPAAPKNAAKNTWEDSNMQQISSSHNMTNTSEPLTATTVDYSEVPCIVVSEDVHKGQEETQLPLSDVCADVNMNPVNNDAEKGVKGSQKALTDTYANVNMGQVDHLELPCKLSKTESLKEKEMIATLLSEFMPSRVGKVNADKSVIIEKKSFYSTNSKASKKLKGNKSDLPSTENEANIMHSLTEMGISLTSCLDVAPISSEISLSGEPSCKKLVIEPPISGLSNKNIVSEEDKSEAAKDNILGKASTANNFISAYDVATYRFLVDKEGTCYIVHNSIDNPVSNSTNANLPNNDMEDAKCSVSVAPTAKEISFHSDVVPKDLCSAPIVGSRDEKSAKKTILTSTTDNGRHAQSCHLDTGGSNAAAIPAENDALSVGDAPQQMSRILTSKEGSDTMNESHEHGVNQDAVSQKNKKFKLCLQEPVLKAVKTEIMDPDDLSSPYFCFSLVVNTLSCHGLMRTRISWVQVRAAYYGLPDFQRARVEAMGFGPFLSIEPVRPDLPLIQVLRERWDRTNRVFLMPWGHMVPSLEDIARIIGLRVDGEAVSGVTLPDYGELAQRLLGLETIAETPRECRTFFRTDLTLAMGLGDSRQRPRESMGEFSERLIGRARAAYCQDPAQRERADRDLRRFLFLMLGRLLLSTKGDVINCRFLGILEDLEGVGRYVWGAALLVHLMADLSTGTGRETTVSGFSPFLQVWSHL